MATLGTWGYTWGWYNDPALPVGDPRVVDATGTPGDVVVAGDVRIIKVKLVVAQHQLLITHPDITANSYVVASWQGNASAAPSATRRWDCDVVAGGILPGLSAGAIAADGPIVVEIIAL